MSLGKMNTFIDIVSSDNIKDAEGFSVQGENIIAHIRAYFEPKNSTEKWSNMAAFESVNAIFRFRKIPNLPITSNLAIRTEKWKYKIHSVEDVKRRGMYIEVLAEKVEGSEW
jgi:head-tail adaptor